MTGLAGWKIGVGAVALSVRDLDRSLDFYRRCDRHRACSSRAPRRPTLGVGGRRLLALEERPGATRDPDAAELYHFALLLPSRAALGRQLRHLVEAGVPLTGAADHHVSEALYLDDPDGHGIELYRDRPREDWLVDGRVRLITNAARPGRRARRGPRGARLGRARPRHGHGPHPPPDPRPPGRARDYYVERLGFDVTHELAPGDLHVDRRLPPPRRGQRLGQEAQAGGAASRRHRPALVRDPVARSDALRARPKLARCPPRRQRA